MRGLAEEWKGMVYMEVVLYSLALRGKGICSKERKTRTVYFLLAISFCQKTGPVLCMASPRLSTATVTGMSSTSNS
jgi:hypothetical protein